jgi:hypothetical protein
MTRRKHRTLQIIEDDMDLSLRSRFQKKLDASLPFFAALRLLGRIGMLKTHATIPG